MNHAHGRERTKHEYFKRALLYGALFFLLTILQCSFFGTLRPFGAVPAPVLGALCAVALLDRPEVALATAIGAGFLLDAVGSTGLCLSPLLFLLLTALFVLVSRKMIPSFLSFAVLLALCSVTSVLQTLITLALTGSSDSVLPWLRYHALGEWFGTFLFSLPLYFPVLFCLRTAEAKGRFRL